jgi:hypothetical protein
MWFAPAQVEIMRVLGLLFCVVAVHCKITRQSVGDHQLRARGALAETDGDYKPAAEKNFDTLLREHQIECQVAGGDHLLVLRILKASHLSTAVWKFGLPSPFVRARVRCPTINTIDRCGEEDPVQTNTKANTVDPVFGVATRSNEEFICVPAGTYDKASLELEVVAEGSWAYVGKRVQDRRACGLCAVWVRCGPLVVWPMAVARGGLTIHDPITRHVPTSSPSFSGSSVVFPGTTSGQWGSEHF